MSRYLICFLLANMTALSACSSGGQNQALPLAAAGAQASPPAVQPSEEIIADSFSVDYIMGKFDPAHHPDFTKVDIAFADRSGHYLRKDTYDAFRKMHAAAKSEGINLKIISAARNFYRQKEIWEAKWNGARLVDGKDISKTIPDPVLRALKILEFSSMPGTSRHHWGTDLDLNALSDAYFQQGEGLKIYGWLQKHAHNFGFCQPYTRKGPSRPDGYEEEKWHWSYMPVSKRLTEKARSLLRDEQISGFDGADTATSIGVVRKYVLGIGEACLH